MTMEGDLGETPLPTVVTALRRRTGVLEVRGLHEASAHALALDRGRLLCLRLGDEEMEPWQARVALSRLADLHEGSYTFTEGPTPAATSYALNWPLEPLLASLTARPERTDHPRRPLPTPDTLFLAMNVEVWLEDPLDRFWVQAQPLLAAEASGREVAAALALPLDHTLQMLHDLCLLGVIAPVRAPARRRPPARRPGIPAKIIRVLTHKAS